jgi:hypothetical protein
MPDGFTNGGSNFGSHTTSITFDSRSYPAVCAVYAGATPPATLTETAPPSESPHETPTLSESPKESAIPAGGLSGGAVAGIVVGVIVLIAVVAVVVFVVLKRPGDAGSHDIGGGDTADEAAASV